MRKFLSLASICSGCAVIALVFSMINTGISSIQADLGLSLGMMQWMMSLFGIINCAALVTCGRLADIYGRKKVFLCGLISSGLGMAAGGFCQGYDLLLCMGFAGLGNAIILPVSQAMLVHEFPDEQKSRAIALWTSVLAAMLAAGPILGGVIASYLGWRWLFWVNFPVIVLSALGVFLYSNESKNEKDPPIADYLGMGFLALVVGTVALLISEYHTLSVWMRALAIIACFGGVVSLYFIEKRVAAPIVQADLFRNGRFVAASCAAGCLVFFIWALFFTLPYYLQNALFFSPLETGFTMLGITLPVAFLSLIIGKLYNENTAWVWIVLGSLLAIISFFIMSLGIIFPGALLFGVAYSCLWGPSTTAAISSFSKERAGVATGTFVTIQEIGGTLGLASSAAFLRVHPVTGFHSTLILLMIVAVLGCYAGYYLRTAFVYDTPLKKGQG